MISKIELTLEINFNPSFLIIDQLNEKTLNIIISSACFINQQMDERVRSVYKCLDKKCPDAFDEFVIFVSAFTDEEINDVVDHLFEGENE